MEEFHTVVNKPFHTVRNSRLLIFNRLFAVIYISAIVALFYHHFISISNSPGFLSISILVADIVLAFVWITTQAFRFRPVRRNQFPVNLRGVVPERELLAIDVFVCTADPSKEPPVSLMNTVLSAMAYDYPVEKISVYVSDDGGSDLTLFALMETAKFARLWLPFCRDGNVMEKSPRTFFRSDFQRTPEIDELERMYKTMESRIENVVERGRVDAELIAGENERRVFAGFSQGAFTAKDHPTIIQVLLENGKDKDVNGQPMPNLVYVSREKNVAITHNFKAGALNTLLRVSGIMTNAPIVTVQDCDMYSNDPQTLNRAMCYFSDPKMKSELGCVQFPQRFHGINKNDIYSCEVKRIFQIHPAGMDGLNGPSLVGSGVFFSRRALFESPSSLASPELMPDHIVEKPITDQSSLNMAYQLASCNYDKERISWGIKMGFRYGSLVEDFFTGYSLHCLGWKSVFCNPERAAFLGDVPITLHDLLTQIGRWSIGVYEVAFSRYSPLIYGMRRMGLLMGLCYSFSAFWPIVAIPITIYAFVPQLALLHGKSIFPMEVSLGWFFVYAFLFIGSYAQDCLEYMVFKGTFSRWWSDQRMWLVKGLTSFLFGTFEFLTKSLGLTLPDFKLTSKVMVSDQRKKYEQGIFYFGVHSPMFVVLSTAALLNLAALFAGILRFAKGGGGGLSQFLVQIFIAGFGVVNGWPVYDAMVIRSDEGKIHLKTTIVSLILFWALYIITSFLFL